MNIFVLNTDTKKCAELHKNKHIVKMPLETAQLLCGVHWMTDNEAPYRLTHKNHPCSIWARECIENYNWLIQLGYELCSEYTNRYGKRHKCLDIIEWCNEHQPTLPTFGKMTDFALAMPDDCKIGNAVDSYNEYYRKYKSHID